MRAWGTYYDVYVPSGSLPDVKDLSADNITSFMNFLKLPKSGSRRYNDGVRINASDGHYWASSPSSDSQQGRYLAFTPSRITTVLSTRRAYGHSIRCFKNRRKVTFNATTK